MGRHFSAQWILAWWTIATVNSNWFVFSTRERSRGLDSINDKLVLTTATSAASGTESARSVNITAEAATYIVLERALANVNNVHDKRAHCYHLMRSDMVADYIAGLWAPEFAAANAGSTPILVYPFCNDGSSIGNHLGTYFNEVSCAMITGAHFIATGSGRLANADLEHLQHHKFMDSFPKIVVNPNPAESDTHAKKSMAANCSCRAYCWATPDSPWSKNYEWIGQQFRRAIDEYLTTINVTDGTQLVNGTDLIARRDHGLNESTQDAGTHQFLPLIPDVAIHYRCGDNIQTQNGNKFGYGILPFSAYSSLIKDKSSVNYMYVLTESTHRSGSTQCVTIIQALFDYLKEQFPATTVVVKRGDDIFVDLARLSQANITICSASTFCFLPAIANQRGHVFFPESRIVSKSYLGPHFHWFADPPVITHVGATKPWYLILYTLHGKKISPVDAEGKALKGGGKSVYLILNQTRHEFGSGYAFEGYMGENGWDDIWYLDDEFVTRFPLGEPLKWPKE
jgi:hypothetical protein